MTRVLLVLATSAGGVGRHVADVAQGLTGTAGYDVLVAGPQRPLAGPGQPGTFAFTPVDISDRPRPIRDLRAVLKLRSLMRRCADHGEMVACEGSHSAENDQKTKISAGVVHAHGLRAGALAGVAGQLIPVRRRPVLVVTLHNALVNAGRLALVHRVLERIVARTASVVLVVAADIGDAIGAQGARDVRLAVVPAPVLAPPVRDRDQVRADLEIPPGTALLVTVARLAPQKGLEVLVDAAALLPDLLHDLPRDLLHDLLRDLPRDLMSEDESGAEPPAVLAVVAGDGPLRAGLERQIAARAAPVVLLGQRDDVADLIAAADLIVLPSRWEGQPLVAQEALRAGAALVATDAGGTAAVVGDGACLVEPGDPTGLAAAIATLLTDARARAQLRVRARQRAQHLPLASDALRHVDRLYREVTRPE